MVEELRRFARGETFDEQPMPGLNSEDLDFRAASESFAPVRKLARRDLETLRLVTGHQGRQVPTMGGMLLFGQDRARHFPDAWIQVGRFEGGDKSRIVDRAEIRSLPMRAIEDAIAFVQKHALHGAEIGALRRREHWSLPPVAVREAVINAVVHADYAQRGADEGRAAANRARPIPRPPRQAVSILLDTCVISELIKPAPDPVVLAWTGNTPEGICFLSAITLGEVMSRAPSEVKPAAR